MASEFPGLSYYCWQSSDCVLSYYAVIVAMRYQYLTVAADLILEGVTEPVRFRRYDSRLLIFV